VKLGLANMLQVGSTRFSALTCIRGRWAKAGFSGHSLSVDWQAWGTKGGLCWRATRDGLRHVPAGPPKSPGVDNPLVIASRDTRQPAGPLRFPARIGTISVEYVSQSIQTTTTRETALLNRKSFLRCAPSAGVGKNALFPSRGIIARGFLGLPLGLVLGLGFAH
jgi:hypothetical protein